MTYFLCCGNAAFQQIVGHQIPGINNTDLLKYSNDAGGSVQCDMENRGVRMIWFG